MRLIRPAIAGTMTTRCHSVLSTLVPELRSMYDSSVAMLRLATRPPEARWFTVTSAPNRPIICCNGIADYIWLLVWFEMSGLQCVDGLLLYLSPYGRTQMTPCIAFIGLTSVLTNRGITLI